jgi:phosphate transport system permease protein
MSGVVILDDAAQEKGELQKLLRRQGMDTFMTVLATFLTVLAVSILFTIFGHILVNGFSSLNWDFFTQIPKPYGETGGGIAQAIVGTLVMLALAGLVAIPIGVGTAIYLSEFGRGKFASTVRFCLELLAELPSIVVGVFVWAVLVRNFTGYSGISGAAALVVIMIPIIAKSVEEILHLVPDSLRESALALGTPRWRVVFKVVVPTVLPGILTGIVLAMARAAGETAPLLLTALGNSFFNLELDKPMAAIPLQIYNYAISPYDDWHQKAWGATLILIVVVAVLSAAVRFYTRSKKIETR